MFVAHRCTCCRAVLRHFGCVVEPDGLFGPELLCPRCNARVQARLTAFGWTVTLVAAVVLTIVVVWLQSRA